MPLPKLTKPLVFFDLEATGVLVELDRIIEVGLLRILPNGETSRLTQRFNPEMKIPCEATEIHGMNNKDLENEPTFTAFAPTLFEYFRDADLGGFALRRLDIPLLLKEFGRAGLPFTMEGRRIVDVSVIFRENERRNLSAAYRYYCGKELVGAHGAQADNDATFEVFLAQLERYPNLPQDIDGLDAYCRGRDRTSVDVEGRLVWRDGQAFFSAGKHKYKFLSEVARLDPDYLAVMVQSGSDLPPDFVHICVNALRGVFPKR